jgi:hypothetical protein
MYTAVVAQPIIQDLPLAVTCMHNSATKTIIGTKAQVLTYDVEEDPVFRSYIVLIPG